MENSIHSSLSNNPSLNTISLVDNNDFKVDENGVVLIEITDNFKPHLNSTDATLEPKNHVMEKLHERTTTLEKMKSPLDCDYNSNNSEDLEKENQIPDTESSSVCEYERLRLENIARNNEFLASLGLENNLSSQIKHKKTKPRPTKRQPTAREIAPRRVSRRLQDHQKHHTEAPEETEHENHNKKIKPHHATEHTEDDIENEDQVYEKSPLYQYMLHSHDEEDNTANKIHTTSKFMRLKSDPDYCMRDSQLKRIYTLEYHSKKPIVAASGKGGIVAIFGDSSKAHCALLSFKAAKSWCSGAQFLEESSESRTPLLVSSNDGTITLWDVNESNASGIPKVIHRDQHLHKSGIYSMHEYSRFVATGSKDSTVGVCAVTETGTLEPIHHFDSIHSDVVKSVRFRDKDILASTGNDRTIQIMDLRSSSSKPQTTIEDACSSVVNSVRWSPAAETHTLVSTSFSPVMRVWDIRNAKDPILELKAHFKDMKLQKPSSIYHPVFAKNGDVVVVPGFGEKSLLMYNMKAGTCLSEGMVGYVASAMVVNDPCSCSGEVCPELLAVSGDTIKKYTII